MPGMPGMEMYDPEDLQRMREQMGIEDPGAQQKQPQQQQQNHYQQTQLGLLDTVKAIGKDLFKKIKSLFGYTESKSEL